MNSGLLKLCRLNGELCYCLIIGEQSHREKETKQKNIAFCLMSYWCGDGKETNVQKCATRADKYLFCKVALSLCFKPRLSAKLFT